MLLDEWAYDNQKLKIEGYFTLSHKALRVDKISGSKRHEMAGFKDVETLHLVLIGQLGKNLNLLENNVSDLSVMTILDQAFDIISKSNELIPARCALIECDVDKVQNLYQQYGFKVLQENQYYKRLGS